MSIVNIFIFQESDGPMHEHSRTVLDLQDPLSVNHQISCLINNISKYIAQLQGRIQDFRRGGSNE